jgi:plastocyanin
MRVLPVAAALVLAATVACQSEASVNRAPHAGTGTASANGSAQQITITTGRTTSDYRFHPSTVVVHPGRVQVVLVNAGRPGSGAPHDWSLTAHPGAFAPLVAAGGTSRTTFTAPAPGRYQFVCTIHTRQGQTGTLVVKAG